MNKAERNKQKLRDKLIVGQANAKIQQAAQEGYNNGHSDGFFNAVAILLFSVMETTNYKRNGLRKIWSKTLAISECLEIPETNLTMDDIKYALLEEASIVTDPEFVKDADKFLKECGGDVTDPKYRAIVEAAMKKYYEISKDGE
jgi:hypothetical protein